MSGKKKASKAPAALHRRYKFGDGPSGVKSVEAVELELLRQYCDMRSSDSPALRAAGEVQLRTIAQRLAAAQIPAFIGRANIATSIAQHNADLRTKADQKVLTEFSTWRNANAARKKLAIDDALKKYRRRRSLADSDLRRLGKLKRQGLIQK
jgi:hypothetical protein